MPNSPAALSELEKQEGREVGRAQRHADRAQDLAPIGGHDPRRRVLQLGAECVIGGDEVPGLATAVDDDAGRAVGQSGRIVGVMDRIGRAIRAGERGAARADGDERHFFRCRDLGHGDADTGVRAADQHVQPVLVGPLAKLRRADVRLVLMVGREHLDLPAEHRAAEVGNRHPNGLDAALTLNIRIDARKIIDIADDDLVGGGVRRRYRCTEQRAQRGRQRSQCPRSQCPRSEFHDIPLLDFARFKSPDTPAAFPSAPPAATVRTAAESGRAPAQKSDRPTAPRTGNSARPGSRCSPCA